MQPLRSFLLMRVCPNFVGPGRFVGQLLAVVLRFWDTPPDDGGPPEQRLQRRAEWHRLSKASADPRGAVYRHSPRTIYFTRPGWAKSNRHAPAPKASRGTSSRTRVARRPSSKSNRS
jgi:hypothetical protein